MQHIAYNAAHQRQAPHSACPTPCAPSIGIQQRATHHLCNTQSGTCKRNGPARTALVFEIVPPLNVTAPSPIKPTPPPDCAQPTQSAPHPVRRHPPQGASTPLASLPRPAAHISCFGAGYCHSFEQRGALGHVDHAAAVGLRTSAPHHHSATAKPALCPLEQRTRAARHTTHRGRAACHRCNIQRAPMRHLTHTDATTQHAPMQHAMRTDATRTDATRTDATCNAHRCNDATRTPDDPTVQLAA